MASFDEYRKKLNSKYGISSTNNLEEEKKKGQSSDVNTPARSSAPSTSSFAGTPFDEYRKKMSDKYLADKIDAQGVDKWFHDSGIAMKGMDRYYESNNGLYVTDFGGAEGVRIGNLLDSSDDVWNYLQNHKDEFENYDDMEAMFSTYRNALRQYDMNNFYTNKFYSQFDDEESYNAYVAEYTKENTRQQTYGGKTPDELWGIIGNMDNGSEKEWVTNYAYSVMTVDDYDRIIAQKEAEHEALVAEWDKAAYENGYSANDPEYREYVDKINASEAEIENLKRNRYFAEKGAKYSGLENNEDYKQYSTQVADDPTSKLRIGNWDIIGDLTYDYINDIDGTREKQDYSGEGNARGNVDLYKYSFMTDTEIAQYNYIYNTEGKKAANEYLDYLSYDLDARRTQQLSERNAEFATEHPVLSSIYSVPTNLLSGIGLIDNIGQNVVQGARELITGEYRPINYNTNAMNPTITTMAIRGTVAQNLADNYGVIDIDEEEHPFWSSVFNGKSLGDVYQLGMSMVDSGTVALLSPVVGTFGTALLGGAAGSQGVLDAVSRGATDSQAMWMGIFNGTFEMLFEKVSLDNLLKGDARNVVMAFLQQGFIEGSEELSTSFANNIADILIMAEKSGYRRSIAAYMDAGLTEEEATKAALKDAAMDMAWDFIGGVISGGVMGGGNQLLGNTVNNVLSIIPEARNAKNIYNTELPALIDEALDLDPNNELAKKIRSRLDQNKNVSGLQIRNLVNQNEAAILAQDISTMESAAADRLVELGETGDATAIGNAIAKQVAGKHLSKSEQNLIASSKYGQRVVNELATDNIRSGEYSTDWTGSIGTKRINVEEYSRLVPSQQDTYETAVKQYYEQHTPIAPAKVEVEEQKLTGNETVDSVIQKAYSKELSGNDVRPILESPEAVSTLESMVGNLNLSGKSSSEQRTIVRNAVANYAATNKVSVQAAPTATTAATTTSPIDSVASKYGKQAGAVRSIYNISPVENIDSFAMAFDTAYTLGLEGGKASAAVENSLTQVMTKAQRMLAYETGAAVRAANKVGDLTRSSSKGGVLRARGMKTADINKRFKSGSNQKTATQVLRSISAMTGFTIELFDSSGDYSMEQGSFDWGSDVVAIDINSGLFNAADVESLAKYAMLRVFCHEFTHTGEKWAPEEYNILRTTVIEALSARKEFDLDYRIAEIQNIDYESKKAEYIAEGMEESAAAEKAEAEKMTWDMASREVVAEAMTDVLPESQFMKSLYEKSPAVGNKLLEALRRFLARVKSYFAELVNNPSREAQALKVEIGGTVKYLEGIVDKWDAMALTAVENYKNAKVETSAENVDSAVTETAAETEELSEAGIIVNESTDSASLTQKSVRYVLDDQNKKKVATALADKFGVTLEEANKWLTAETSLASLILNPKYSMFLDYEADPDEVAIKQNSDYPQGTVDFSNICKKRREFTQVMNRVLRNFPNHVFAATDLAKIRTIMGEEGMTLPCGICYVEDRRQLDSVVAQDFIDALKLYREGSTTRPDGKPFNPNQLKGLQLTDGDSYVPSIYELVTLEGRNSLKAKNSNMEAAWVKYNNARGMQSVRLLTNEAEYKRQILKYTEKTVQSKNDHGGLRIYSFSNAEMFHLIDIVQVLTDCATVGLKVQGYTKVNEYAKAVKDTGEKLNRSLIPAGDLGYHIEDGKVVLDFDNVEGIDTTSADFFDNKDNPDIGNILIGINATQIRAAMVSDFVDQIIPFHTGQSSDVLGEKGIAAWENYKDFQSEIDISTGKKSKHQINIYTEVIQAAEQEGKPIQNKRDFVNKFLAVCKENGLQPRFSEFLNTDANGDYIYTEGYHKFLVDFKTFAQTEVGEYLPQMPVKPIFDNEYITGLLKDYVKEQQTKDAEVAKQMPKVIERITNDIIKPRESEAKQSTNNTTKKQYSNRSVPPVEHTAGDQSRTEPARYSYEWFVAKPDMAITMVDTQTPTKRADVVAEAKKNAAAIGKSEGGSVAVHVNDIGTDVVLSTGGLRHGLDRRFSILAPITIKAGEILQNSIKLNEMTPKLENVSDSYVLIGAAQNADGELYIVQSVVNRYSNELTSMDVLYAINTKKESAGRLAPQGSQPNGSYLSDSVISIAELLDYVNKYFPDILPEDVYKHYGHDTRPSGELGERARFSRRTQTYTDREVLELAADVVDMRKLTPGERDALNIFGNRLRQLKDLQEQRDEQRRLLAEEKSADTPDESEIRKITNRLIIIGRRLKAAENSILSIEDKQVLKKIMHEARGIVEREQRSVIETRSNTEKYKARVTETALTLSNWLRKNSDKEHVPEVLKKPLLELLTSIDFSSKRSLNGGELTQADKKFGANLAALQSLLEGQQGAYEGKDDAIDNIGAYLDMSVESRTFLNNLVNRIASTNGTFTINRMTAEDLKDFSNFLKNIATAIRKANRTLANARYKDLPSMAQDSMLHFEDMGNASAVDGTPIAKFFTWTNTTPYYAFKRFGAAGASLFDGFTRGWEKLAFNSKEIIDFTNETYKPEEIRKWRKTIHDVTLEDGSKIKMTTAQIMALSQLVGREQAMKHIAVGGIRVGNIETKKGIIQDVTHYHFTENDLKNVIGMLDERQLNVAKALRKFMAKRGGEWGNEISMARFGYEFYTENDSYYPIKTDATGRPMKDTDEQTNSMFRLLNLSSSKSLNPNANNALIVGDIFDTFSDHMSDMAKLNALGLPLLDAIKWYNYTERTNLPNGTMDEEGVKKSMEKAFGTAAGSYFRTLLKDINGVKEAGDRGGNLTSKLMSNYKIASVAANIRVALLQPTSYVRAMYVLKPKNMINALVFKKNAYKEAMQYSGTAVWKSLGYYDTDIARSMRSQIEHDETWLDVVKDKSMILAEIGDKRTWGRLWIACKLEAKERNSSLAGEELKKATADIFREVIYATQVMDSTLTRSEMMRGSSKWTKAATAFMSEPTLSANILMDSASQFAIDTRKTNARTAWNKNKGKIALAFATYVSSAAFAALMESLWDAFRDDDDYESFLEKFWQAFIGEDGFFSGNLGQDLTIFGKIPVLKDIISTMKGNKSSDMSIASVESITNAFNIWKETIQLANGTLQNPTEVTWNGKMTDWGKIYKTLQALSQLSGVAVANLTRDVVAIWNTTIGAMAPSLKIKTYDPGEKSQIRYAYEDGYLTDEEAIEQLVTQGLVDNEDEAYWTVQGWEAGEGYSRYNDIYDAVRNGGDFDAAMDELTAHGYTEKDVLSEVKSKIGEWYRNGEITSQQATSMLGKYVGLGSDEITEEVNKWSFKVDYGYSYDDKTSAFKTGEISAPELINILVDYGGKTQEEAAETVVSYTRDAYEEGYFDRNKAADIMMQYGGLTDAEAETKLRYIDFTKEYPDIPVDSSWIDEYYNDVESSGIAIDVFVGYRNQVKGITGEDKKARRMAVIDSLPITDAQKDALYFAEGWAASKLYEAPWH